MSLDASRPVPPLPGAVTVGMLAEDPFEVQHPALQRLRQEGRVGEAVRRSAVWGAGSKVASQLLQFLGLLITARLLLPSHYGQAAIVFPVIAFGNLFTTLGLTAAIIHARRVTEKLMSTAFWVNVVAGVVLASIVTGLSFPLSQLFRSPGLVSLLSLASLVFIVNMSIVQTALLERTLRFKEIAVVETGCAALGIAVVVVAALAGAGAHSLVLGPLATQSAVTICMWVIVRWLPRARPDRESLRELWTYARGITGFKVLNFWSRNADNLLLARFVPLAELGNYSRAYNLMTLPVGQVNNMMGRVLFPALTRLRDDRPRMGRAWLRALSTASALMAPVTFGMAVSAPALVETLFGERWLGMVPVLQLLAVSALPQTLTTPVASVLRATGATDLLFRLGLLTSALSLVAIVSGLPWGTVGVASALAVKFYLEVFISVRPCLQQMHLRWRDLVLALRGVWISCLTMAAVGIAVRVAVGGSWAAWQVLLTQVGLCAGTYLTMLWFTHRAAVLSLWAILRAGLGRRAPVAA